MPRQSVPTLASMQGRGTPYNRHNRPLMTLIVIYGIVGIALVEVDRRNLVDQESVVRNHAQRPRAPAIAPTRWANPPISTLSLSNANFSEVRLGKASWRMRRGVTVSPVKSEPSMAAGAPGRISR
jgi:hypothetical protein